MPFFAKTSPARSKFKKMLGNANHLIITTMVGLDAIDRGIVSSAPGNFPAVWNPKDCSASAQRSRILILDMGLVRAVDALDAYMMWANRRPFLIQSSDFKSDMDGTGRSVSKRFQVFEQHTLPKDHILSALVATTIRWRNKAVHSEDRVELNPIYHQTLEENEEEISNRFRGLETSILLRGYANNRSPHLKEVTSFINAMHQYVRAIDASLLEVLDSEQYLKEMIWAGICKTNREAGSNRREQMRLIHNKWGKSLDRKKQAVEGFLRHEGLSYDKPVTTEPYIEFADSMLENVISMTPREIFEWAKPL